MKSAVSAAGVVTIFAGMIAAAFWGAMSLGFSPIDDAFLIVENLAVIGPSSTALMLAWTTFDPELFIPVTIMSYHLDMVVHGLSAWWMHGEDITLHIINTVLVWRLLTRWTGRGVGSAVAAALFAVHPVQTETVVWLSARKDVLMTFFTLSSLLTFEHHLARPSRTTLLGSAALFALALLSKPSALLVPMVMALRMAMVNGGEWRRVTTLWPHAVVTVVLGAVGVLGKSHVLGLGNPLTAVGLAAQSLVWTVGKTLFMVPLRVSYDVVQPSSVIMVASVLACAAVGWFALRSWRRSPLITIGLAWFVVVLLPPALNLRTGGIATLAADRYAYLPLIGLLLAGLGAGERWLRTETSRRFAAAICGIVALACIPLTRAQVALWESGETLFATSLERQPDAVSTRIALARTLQQQGKLVEAFDTLKEGLRYGESVQLHIAAGYVYAKTGDTASAEEQFMKAMALDPANPDAHFARGSLLRQLANEKTAEEELRTAIRLDPSYVEARLELSKILIARREWEAAAAELHAAIAWNPSSGEARNLLASVLLEQGKTADAEEQQKLAEILGNPL